MARIAHIAVKVDDIEQSAQFYEKALGFVPIGKSRSENRSRGSFSDGEINLTLLRYDSEDTAMAQAAGQGPCIHHFAIEVDDVSKYVAQVRAFGCEILSDPNKAPVKFRAPGGTIAEIVPVGRYRKGME
jgi:lactoylglutathione lyase